MFRVNEWLVVIDEMVFVVCCGEWHFDCHKAIPVSLSQYFALVLEVRGINGCC
ncbi:hypothetical protein D9M71_770130 [compost metagenome]